MRVGLMLPPSDDFAGPDSGGVAGQARGAERLGFDYLAGGEHLFFYGPTGNAFITLAAAAGATERIRLLSSLTILPLYPAALAAKLTASLDIVSGGRFELGVGIGGEYPPEFAAAGVPVAERGARTDEALEVVTRLLAGERLTFEGRFTRVDDQLLQPPAVQRPRPPIWVGGRKPAAMRRAGRYADVWMPYMITPERLADSLATARAAAEEAGRDPADVRGAVFVWGAVDADGQWARRVSTEVVGAVYAQDFSSLAGKYVPAGTPAQVTARLLEYAEAGAESVVLSPACMPADRDKVVRTFAEEVMPALHELGR